MTFDKQYLKLINKERIYVFCEADDVVNGAWRCPGREADDDVHGGAVG